MTHPLLPMPMFTAPRIAWLVFAALMLLTVAVYWPALDGGYLFDDTIYVVDNTDVHVSTLHAGEWAKAALSQAGALQFRALSMLSFAANYYFTGLDPFWFKLTNVGIHALNGFLLFLLLRELFRLRTETTDAARSESGSTFDLVAATIAGVWLLLPINLTAVAYVSQRMEALANVFVFIGLLGYLRVRRRQYWRSSGNSLALLGYLMVFTGLGLCAKESAVLLPLYTMCIEIAVTGFRNNDGKVNRPVVWTHVAVLVLPIVAGAIWLSGWIFKSAASIRTFSIGERLLTEPRVLLDYIGWTLLPNLKSLTFYHDDLAVSHGLLDPPTTLLAIVALIGLLGFAFWQRKARPLFCLGILWFFAGHALTATVIPLELVFEHRNYFPSVGLLLAAASLLALEPGLRLPAAKALLATGFIAFCAFTTLLRAEEWSHPLRLAYAEALKRPDSPRAQYELARTLIVAAGSDEKSPLIDDSIKILQRNAYQPNSGIAALQALIFLNGRAHRDIDPAWWQAIVKKLQAHAPSQTDVSVLVFLFHCQLRGECPPQKQELFDAFTAALTTSEGNVNLMSAYADFAFRELDDRALAEQMYREVIATKPQVPVYRANLVRFLIAIEQFDAAESALAGLDGLNRLGSLDPMIAALKTELAAAKTAPTAAGAETYPAADVVPAKPDPN